MPFPDQEPRPFTQEAIEAYAAEPRGCYGLFNDADCVFVGRGRIRERLLAHLSGGVTEEAHCIRDRAPTYWLVEETEDFIVRHLGLVVEYQPHCNR